MDSDPINRLLVVDDEGAQVKALCHTLEDEGYSVEGFTGRGRRSVHCASAPSISC